jgi:glyoxylase-like metal-dependent hydrolase (beta-lactamase superfamily II)
MRTFTGTWPVTALAAIIVSVSALAQPVNPVVREGVTEKISDHVYVIPDGSVPLVPNVGIIVGTHGTFVVDTGLGVRNGEAVVREMQKVKRSPDLFLATTHVHPEHDLGAMAFPAETKFLRSTDQVTDIAENGLTLAKQFSTRSPFIADLLKDAHYRKADTVFERETTIDLGGVRVRLLAMGANHTGGDTAIFVEPDGVLFSGDVAMKPQPAFMNPRSTTKHWLASLDVIEQLKPTRIVPSHGPMGGLDLIAGYRTYLTTIQTRAAELKKQGKTLDETVQLVTAELTKYPDKGRLGGAVKAAFAEAP